MDAFKNPALPPSPHPRDSKEERQGISPLAIVGVMGENRWLIAGVTVLSLGLGAGFAMLQTPIYEANTLIAVEDSKNGAGGMLSQAQGLMDDRSSAATEMEILRSRLVVGKAVANLQLDLDIQSKQAGMVERIARLLERIWSPGSANASDADRTIDKLRISSFEVPAAQTGKYFILRTTITGFELLSPLGQLLVSGRPREDLIFKIDGRDGRLVVAEMPARPGEEYMLARHSRLKATEALQRSLQIAEQGRGTGVIKASVEGADPEHIARIVNEVAALFVRQNIDRKSEEVAKSLVFLDNQLPALRRQLEESEDKFNRFRRQAGVFELSSEASTILSQSSALQLQMVEMRQKRDELSADVTDNHPAMQKLDQQIRAVQMELDRLGSKAQSLPNTEQDLLRLTRDVKVNQEIYSSLLNSYQQLRLAKESKVGNVRVIDMAAVPEVPIRPKQFQIMMVAGAAGFLLSLGVALFRNSLKHAVQDASDIERHTGLNVYAEVPFSKAQAELSKLISMKAAGTHVLAQTATDDIAVESFRSLRTAMQFALVDGPGNVVVVTGPSPGVGKTFSCINLACVLGMAGKRVLLIDADLRRGHVNQYFGLPREPGLSEVLSGAIPVQSVIRSQLMSNVDLLMTGVLPPNPAELLMSQATGKLIKEVSERYDLVLIDAPPVLPASEAAVLATHAAATLFVARAEQTSVSEIDEAVKRLGHSGAKVKGVILNGLNLSKRLYGYGYRYGGMYRYKYSNYKY